MSDFDSIDYRYRPYSLSVQAVQLTLENAAEVAVWCGGRVVELHYEPRFVELFLPMGDESSVVYEGTWVVREMLHGFPVFELYDTEQFRETYRPMVEKTGTPWPAQTAPIPTPHLETGL